MTNLIADIQIAPNGGFTGFGKLGLEGQAPASAIITFKDFISSAIGVMTIIAIIWFVFVFITGSISYLASGGDKANIESARKRIVNGLIGLVLTIAAVFIIRLIGFLLGIPDILNFPLLFVKAGGLIVNP